ncbi:hypothetical protein CMI44_01550 [Candidatus Pacearchaeota archaeon]|nr:hypothetical protein [Candidatus Pacearchaeota archaeon]
MNKKSDNKTFDAETDKYRFVPKSDLVEMQKNRNVALALNLFQKIKEDFFEDPFTLEEIKDAYNRPNRSAHRGYNYGQKNLDTLVELELIEENSDGSYEINYASEHLARREMDDHEDSDINKLNEF